MHKINKKYLIQNLSIIHYFIIFFLIPSMMISICITYVLYQAASSQITRDIKRRVADIATISSLNIDANQLQNLQEKEDQNTSSYRKIQKKLQKIKAESTDIYFIYTMRLNSKNKIEFVVDAEHDPEQSAILGEIYTQASPLLKKSISSLNSTLVEQNFYTDKWGTWLSGYAPIKSSNGSLVGVLGVDISATTVAAYQNKLLFMALTVFLISLPLICLAGLYFGKKFSAPILKIKQGAEQIASGNLDINLIPPKSMELASLAKSMNIMAVSLKQKQVERDRRKAAEAASRAKSEFLANMSHEIRTPLNAVMGLTDLVMRTKLTEKQQSYLYKIKLSSKSLLSVINDILDFSKIEAGRLDLETVNFSLYELLANVSEMFSYKAYEKNLELIISIAPNVPTALQGDPTRLGQILINLLSNALKFTSQGEIIVDIKVEPGTVPQNKIMLRFSVQDSGIGIDLKQHENIFDSFSQADGSTTRKYGGTGLGLAICRKLSNLMGGDIKVESSIGQGSCFSFTALFKLQAQEKQLTIKTPKDLRGLKVLVVDDNCTALEILVDIIKSFDMEAVSASSGAQALQILQSDPEFDLVLLDWKMPQMNGLDTAKQIKRGGQDKIPVICMISAYGREDLIQQTDKNFLDAFLSKPVNQSLLFDTIMELFGRHEYTVSNPVPQKTVSLANEYNFQGINVLLVEDNEVNQEIALEWLHSAGIKTSVAANGLAAVNAVQEKKFDAVLMDIQMPKMDGFQATKQIREKEKFASLPIIAMTAHALKGDREKCLQAGMNDYVTKPIDPQKLFAALAKWTGKKTEEYSAVSNHLPSNSKTEEKAEWKLPGIDTNLGLARANNNYKLYLKLLRTFARDFGQADQQLQEFAVQEQYEEARRLAHSIKGVAANIGAQELSQQAALLENDLKDEQLPKSNLQQGFSLALQKVLQGLKNNISDKTKQKTNKQVDIQTCLSDIQKIQTLLDDDLGQAREILEKISPSLQLIVEQQLVNNILESIDNFEIDEASQLLDEIQNILQKKEE